MYHGDLISFYENQQLQILETIGELVKEETPTDEKVRLDLFAAQLSDQYAAAGLETETVENQVRGDHIRARFEQAAHVESLSAAPALILCHYDTVWPVGSLETHPFRVDDQGWAYGPGIFDMQSSLALVEYVLLGVQSLNLRLPRPVTVLVTSDEEVGQPYLAEADRRGGTRRRLCPGAGAAAAWREAENYAQGWRSLCPGDNWAGRARRSRAGKRASAQCRNWRIRSWPCTA